MITVQETDVSGKISYRIKAGAVEAVQLSARLQLPVSGISQRPQVAVRLPKRGTSTRG
jgi:hypothetical protein